MIKINFGHSNDQLKDWGFVDIPIHADLSQPLDVLTKKIADILIQQFPDMDSQDTVHICVPGASLLVVAVLTAIHGIVGVFPTIVPVMRDNNGGFAPQTPVDMQMLRTHIRSSRKNTIII